MDRRSFVVRTLAAVPFLSVPVVARRFKDITMVTVTHDGETPVGLRIVGDVIRPRTRLVSYDKSNPLTLTTPAEFYVSVEKQPTVIEATGNRLVKVVADREISGQHLMARARRITIRRIAGAPLPNAAPPIE